MSGKGIHLIHQITYQPGAQPLSHLQNPSWNFLHQEDRVSLTDDASKQTNKQTNGQSI